MARVRRVLYLEVTESNFERANYSTTTLVWQAYPLSALAGNRMSPAKLL